MRKINVIVPGKPFPARSAEGIGDMDPVGGQLGRVA